MRSVNTVVVVRCESALSFYSLVVRDFFFFTASSKGAVFLSKIIILKSNYSYLEHCSFSPWHQSLLEQATSLFLS